jgi:lipoprotein NlpI
MSRISKQASLARLLIPALFPALRTGSGFTIDAADHAGGAITGAVIGIILLTVWKSNQAAPGHRRAAGAAALACVLLLGVGLWQGIGTGFALAGDYAETAQQWDRALDDARLAVELNPRDSENYNVRGEAEFALGRFLSAAADYETSGQLTPSWEYWHILASLARVHAGADFATEFRTQAPPPAGAAWPGPVIAFYHGKISLAELLAAANARPPYDSETPAQKNCEAAFYLGEYETLHKQAAAAESLVGQAIASCPQDYLEYQLAAAERARL